MRNSFSIFLAISIMATLLPGQLSGLQPRFLLQYGEVTAEPGDRAVHLPVLLSNLSDSIGGWDLLLKYDDSGGRVVNVELCDSVLVEDSLWYYAPWILNPDLRRPDYFEFSLNQGGHPEWLRVIAIMNMPEGDVVPPLPPGDEQLLFCLSYDVSAQWDGHDVQFDFQTNDCGDNILIDVSGYIVWGPDTSSAPISTCPLHLRPYDLRVVTLSAGTGIRKPTGIDDTSVRTPAESFLFHQHPNPLSSSTDIRFYLPQESRVSVEVYNLVGGLVTTLTDGEMSAGYHVVRWNTQDVSSGLYFLRIEVNSGDQTLYHVVKKLTVLK